MDAARIYLGTGRRETLRLIGVLAICYHGLGRHVEAVALGEEEVELSRRLLGDEHRDTLTAMENLAGYYSAAELRDEALASHEDVLSLKKQLLGAKHSGTLSSMSQLAYAYWNAGRLDNAETLFRDYVMTREKQGANDWVFSYARSSLGAVLMDLERYNEAEPFLLAGHQGLEAVATEKESEWLKQSVRRLADLYERWEKPQKAADWQTRVEGREDSPEFREQIRASASTGSLAEDLREGALGPGG